jgi:putative Holliday junction resolvase
MRIVGIDGGRRRVGVARSDELGIIAQPLATVERTSDRGLLEGLAVALEGEPFERFVVGLPLRLDGTEGGAAREARRLAALLADSFGVPADLWDERLTTAQAERILLDAGLDARRRRGPTDRVAAAIMLQSYLDAHRERREEGRG